MSDIKKVFCERKGRKRIAFRTRDKAAFFIEHYDDFMEGEIEFKPTRSFYCKSCNMWHITHLPLQAEYNQVEERDRKIQELQALADRIKVEFRKAKWETWKPIVEEGLELLESFRSKGGFEKLVESVGTPIEHCMEIIRTSYAKESGCADDDFKRLRKSIDQAAKALDFAAFEQSANEMEEHFSQDYLRKVLMPANRQWLEGMTSCLNSTPTMKTIQLVMEHARESVPDSRDVNVTDLYDNVLAMTLWMDGLFVSGLPRTVWDVLQSKVKKITNVLECCFHGETSDDGYPLMEKVRIVATEKMLLEAATCIGKGETELATTMVQAMDARLGVIPFSAKKIELMKEVCRLGEELLNKEETK